MVSKGSIHRKNWRIKQYLTLFDEAMALFDEAKPLFDEAADGYLTNAVSERLHSTATYMIHLGIAFCDAKFQSIANWMQSRCGLQSPQVNTSK